MSSEFDRLDPEQIRAIARACGFAPPDAAAPPDPISIPRARSMKTRMRYARAAFIGDVRMPLVAVIVFVFIFTAGWAAASYYYKGYIEEQAVRERYQGALDSNLRILKYLSRVRESPEETAAFHRVVREIEQMVAQDAQRSGLDVDRGQSDAD